MSTAVVVERIARKESIYKFDYGAAANKFPQEETIISDKSSLESCHIHGARVSEQRASVCILV
jgi:hypothetical protein